MNGTQCEISMKDNEVTKPPNEKLWVRAPQRLIRVATIKVLLNNSVVPSWGVVW